MTDMRLGRQYRPSTNHLPKSQGNADGHDEYHKRVRDAATQSRALLEAMMRYYMRRQT